MNRLRFGVLTATLATVGAFVPLAAFADGSNGACWGSATSEDATQDGGLGDHAKDVNAGGFIDSRTSAQDLNIADRPGRAGLGELKNLFDNGFEGLVSFLGESC